MIAARTLHEVYGAKMLPWLIGGECVAGCQTLQHGGRAAGSPCVPAIKHAIDVFTVIIASKQPAIMMACPPLCCVQ